MSYTEMAQLELMNALNNINSEAELNEFKDFNKFVDCAITAGADYIVTEDSHFDHLKKIPFPRLNVLTLDEFMQTRLVK